MKVTIRQKTFIAPVWIRIILLLLLPGSVVIPASVQDLQAKIDSVNTLPYEYIVSHAHVALKILQENLKQARSLNYKFGTARAFDRLHIIYNVLGDREAQTEAALSAIKLYEELDALPELVNLYGRFGYQQRKLDAGKARLYMRKGIRLAEQNQLRENLCSLYDDYGVLLEEAADLDSAMYYYRKALAVKKVLKDTIGIPYTLNNIAGLYALMGQYKQALRYAAESDSYRNREQGEFGRALNLVLYGEIYNQMGKTDSAFIFFKRCLNKSKKLKYKDLIRYTYQKLTELYEKKNDFQNALQMHKKYVSYKDSLINIATNEKIAELEIAYETEKKDLQIVQNKLEIRRKNTFLLITLILIVSLSLIAAAIYRFQKLKREKLRKELEYENQVKQYEIEKKWADEKLRIARELHDNIGSQLTFMISSADNLVYGIQEDKVRRRIARLSQFGRETMNELRNSIWAMKQENGDVEALILKLNEIKKKLNENENTIEMEILNNLNRSFRLRSIQMLNLYRIVQEAVQNVVKHASANRIEIRFNEQDSGFVLSICDNGCGFNMQQTGNGHGLENMKQRCLAAGGELHIESGEEGTKIYCILNNLG